MSTLSILTSLGYTHEVVTDYIQWFKDGEIVLGASIGNAPETTDEDIIATLLDRVDGLSEVLRRGRRV